MKITNELEILEHLNTIICTIQIGDPDSQLIKSRAIALSKNLESEGKGKWLIIFKDEEGYIREA